jgi:anion-transporting  ArsA/GET3 family ATPase
VNQPRTDTGLGELLEGKSLAVVAGSGGVGKTTVSAALGLAATNHLDGDVLVLTIDPARRLASALGIAIDGNAPVEIPIPRIGRSRKPRSRVFAAMLDPGPAWDAMVRAEATPEVADRIIDNPVYRRIADTFVHGNDYAALGWLAEAIATDRYRLIIVDTPPSQNALDFFDAPRRVEEFFGSSLLGWLTGGDGSLVGGAAAKTFATLADKLLGDQFFADVVEFFQLMREVVPSMVARTMAVSAELAGDDAAFIAVTSPSQESADRLMQLAEVLSSRELAIDAVVANGVEPEVFWSPKTLDVAQRIVRDDRSPLSSRSTALLAPGAEYVIERCEVAKAQSRVVESLPKSIVSTVPRRVHSPTNVPDLLELGELLWSGPPADS